MCAIPHDLLPFLELFVVQETNVQHLLQSSVIELFADEHELLATIAPFPAFGYVMLDECVHLFIASDVLFFRKGAEPRPAARDGKHSTSLRPVTSAMRSCGE